MHFAFSAHIYCSLALSVRKLRAAYRTVASTAGTCETMCHTNWRCWTSCMPPATPASDQLLGQVHPKRIVLHVQNARGSMQLTVYGVRVVAGQVDQPPRNRHPPAMRLRARREGTALLIHPVHAPHVLLIVDYHHGRARPPADILLCVASLCP